MLKRVGSPSLTTSLRIPLLPHAGHYTTYGYSGGNDSTAVAATGGGGATWNGIAFGASVLQIRFTHSITHGKKRKARDSLAGP